MCYAKDLHRKQITVAKTIFLLNLNEAEPERWLEPSYFADTLRHCLVVKKISSFQMADARRHCDKCLAATKCDKKCVSLGSFHVLPGFEYFALPFARPCLRSLALYMERNSVTEQRTFGGKKKRLHMRRILNLNHI